MASSTKRATHLRRLAFDTRGATMVEYALLLALILVTGAAVYRQVGKDVRKAGDMTVAAFH